MRHILHEVRKVFEEGFLNGVELLFMGVEFAIFLGVWALCVLAVGFPLAFVLGVLW